MNTLTPRQLEVAHLLTQGLPNKEIARKMGISYATAAKHVENIYQKLGTNTRVEAALILTRTEPEHPQSCPAPAPLPTTPPAPPGTPLLWLTLIHQETPRLVAIETTTSCAHAALDMASLLADILAALTHRVEALEKES